MNGYKEILGSVAEFNSLTGGLKNKITPINIMGVSDSIRAHLIFCACEELGKSAFVVAENEVQARRLTEDLNSFFGGGVMFFPSSDLLFYDIEAAGRDIRRVRLDIFERLIRGTQRLHIVTTIEALLGASAPKRLYEELSFSLEIGDVFPPDELAKRLTELGYRREEAVEGAGQFSIRGGVADFFPPCSEMPYRIEYFDDEVDSLRIFDAATQRSVSNINEVRVTPADEILLCGGERERLIERLEKQRKDAHSKAKEGGESGEIKEKLASRLGRDAERLREGISFPSIVKYIPYIYEKYDVFPTLADYIDDRFITFWDEPSRISAAAKADTERLEDVVAEMTLRGIIPPSLDAKKYAASCKKTIQALAKNGFVGMSALSRTSPDYSPKKLLNFSAKSIGGFRGKIEFLIDSLKFYIQNGYRIVIPAGSETKALNLVKTLSDDGIEAVFSPDFDALLPQGRVLVTRGSLSGGFEYTEARIAVISDKEIFGKARKKRRSKNLGGGERFKDFTDLSIGDYVVHETHGIGRYIGIKQLDVDGVRRDYLHIRYKGEDTLYIPTDQLGSIYKYAGKDGAEVRLNKLGGAEWNRTKQRVREAASDMARKLIALYAARETIDGIAFSPDNEWQREFEAAFPYEETDDQLRCAEEVKADMQKPHPMDRLLCGDVGYGKTEVAMRAAFKAVLDGYQVAYLVPTTILANQHTMTFRQRMRDYPVEIEMLSRFRTAAQQREIIKRLKTGETDIVIGTHKLLGKDVEFKKLGLLIIDEEQRFGVSHKERIKELKKEIDVLTLSATPIPRTLNMAMMGVRDMSVIAEPPHERYPVATYVMEYDADVIFDAVTKELGRGGQVYYLHNRVRGIYKAAEEIARKFPNARVAAAHGRMSESELEDIMFDFSNGEIDILVCTTIIETGLDIPNVNTIIIEDCDRFGLAQLYQLRGRVGRSGRLAYAYLMYTRGKELSEQAEKRLTAIREFTEFGSGFKIAMRDLEIRGAGNIIGAQQHGHMEAVGYEMYCRLLEDAVGELRGIERKEKPDTLVDLPVSGYIPEEYITSHRQRIDGYKKIASITSREDMSDVYDELTDCYGSVPSVTDNLMHIACIKAFASNRNITEIIGNRHNIKFYFNPQSPPDIQSLIKYAEENPNMLKINQGARPNIFWNHGLSGSEGEYLKQIEDFLEILSFC